MFKRIIGVSVFFIAINLILVNTHAMAAPSRVFVTSTTYFGGGVGGLSAADVECNLAAQRGSLGGTYTAWLSDDMTNAADRVYHNPDGYITTNGDMVANNWEALINADNVDLLHTINYDEYGADVGTVQPWTGTYENGQATAYNCNNWISSSSDDRGTAGLTNDDGWYWSEYVNDRCNSPYPLYCFEDGPDEPVPTINEWGLVILALLIAGSAVWFLRRRKTAI
jgi:hypothetical protein